MEYTTKDIELSDREREISGLLSGSYSRVDGTFLYNVVAWALKDAVDEECRLYAQLSELAPQTPRQADIVFDSPQFQQIPTNELIELAQSLAELHFIERDFLVL
jgi:hypothetical protein